MLKEAASEDKLNILNTIVKHYQHFDELVFSMTDASKQSIEEVNRMNVYQFYSFKRYLQEKAKKMKEKNSIDSGSD